MKLTPDFKKNFFSRLKLLLLICLVYYLMTWFTGCPILYFTGISCPGCGMTRAWLAVLQLDFARAFACHPLFLFAPVFAGVFLLEDRIDFHRYRWLIVVTAALFLATYLIRMIWFPDDIVVFQPENGLIFRIFHNIIQIAKVHGVQLMYMHM